MHVIDRISNAVNFFKYFSFSWLFLVECHIVMAHWFVRQHSTGTHFNRIISSWISSPMSNPVSNAMLVSSVITQCFVYQPWGIDVVYFDHLKWTPMYSMLTKYVKWYLYFSPMVISILHFHIPILTFTGPFQLFNTENKLILQMENICNFLWIFHGYNLNKYIYISKKHKKNKQKLWHNICQFLSGLLVSFCSFLFLFCCN